MNTIDVTVETFFERLYLVLGLRTIAPWVNCPYTPTNPNCSFSTYFSISVNFFFPNVPSFFWITIWQVIWTSPSTLAPVPNQTISFPTTVPQPATLPSGWTRTGILSKIMRDPDPNSRPSDPFHPFLPLELTPDTRNRLLSSTTETRVFPRGVQRAVWFKRKQFSRGTYPTRSWSAYPALVHLCITNLLHGLFSYQWWQVHPQSLS